MISTFTVLSTDSDQFIYSSVRLPSADVSGPAALTHLSTNSDQYIYSSVRHPPADAGSSTLSHKGIATDSCHSSEMIASVSHQCN